MAVVVECDEDTTGCGTVGRVTVVLPAVDKTGDGTTNEVAFLAAKCAWFAANTLCSAVLTTEDVLVATPPFTLDACPGTGALARGEGIPSADFVVVPILCFEDGTAEAEAATALATAIGLFDTEVAAPCFAMDGTFNTAT